MLDRSRKFRVGLFVLGSSSVFVVLLFLAIGTSFTREMVSYTIQFEETVKGMVVGSSVNFQGVQIGSVSDMRFVHGRTEVQVELDPSRAPITERCRASLDRAWVTGQVTVELSGWHDGAPVLPAGALIRAELSPMSSLARTLPGMLDDLSMTLREYRLVAENVNALLGGQNAEAFAQLLRSGQELVDGVGGSAVPLFRRMDQETLPRVHGLLDLVADLGPRLGETLAALQHFSRRLEEICDDPGLREAIAEAPELVASLSSASASVGRGADELRHLLRGQGPGLAAALATLDTALRELGSLARLLRSTPSALVFGESKKERAGVPAAPSRRDR